MISSVDLINSFSENRLQNVISSLLYCEELTYQWVDYEKGNFKNRTKNREECKEYVYQTIVLPFWDLDKCFELIKEEKDNAGGDLYKKNLSIKKLAYFKAVMKLKEVDNLNELLSSINWYILKIRDNSQWNNFVSMIKGEKNISEVRNTRLMKGLKPNKVSSKIIYNRNGR
jgi:hypothetical protein